MTGKERQQKALAIFQKMDKTVSSAQKKKTMDELLVLEGEALRECLTDIHSLELPFIAVNLKGILMAMENDINNVPPLKETYDKLKKATVLVRFNKDVLQ